ncbi:PE-PGRS family protein [Streptomyces ovatisporus]|uniref:PE-PGRS family protein n=1 Tax=Streptomyces ovatisporus TaxID=1128682 RepID=A0ABV9A016_9ACTN
MVSRPPQWQQDANRHTQIVDPVITIQELTRFKSLRPTRIDYALVFTTSKGEFDTYLPPHRPSRSEIAAHRWTTVYEVDTGLHQDSRVFELPSSNDAFAFEVTLGCTWQVKEPAKFVGSGERNVPALAQRLVDSVARPLLRRRGMEESAEAEQDVQRALREQAGSFGAAEGLSLSCGVQIRRDEAAIRHEHELRAIRYERAKLEPGHDLAMREDELAAERALAQGRQRHLTEQQEQELGHERALAKGKHELELQEIEAKKIEYYTYYLERGGPATMAFHLAKHPEDTRLVMENLRQDHLNMVQNQLQVAVQALGGGPGGLEEHQLDEPRKLAAKVMRDFFSQRFPGSRDEPAAGVEQGRDAAEKPGVMGEGVQPREQQEDGPAGQAASAAAARSKRASAAAVEASRGGGTTDEGASLFGYHAEGSKQPGPDPSTSPDHPEDGHDASAAS